MHKILVFIYCYKNKNIYNIVKELEDKSSKKNNILYAVYDQNNENKIKEYVAYKNISYNHIFWDRRQGISKYRNQLLSKDYDYFFEIGNLISIKENWDTYLIELLNDNDVVLNNDVNFLDFVFMHKKHTDLFNKISSLVFYGQHLYLLYYAYINNIKVKVIDNDYAILDINTILKSDYVPYVLYSEYNNVLKTIKGDSEFIDYVKRMYQFNVLSLKEKSYNEDKLDYSNLSYDSDSLQVTRFNTVKKQMVKSQNFKDSV